MKRNFAPKTISYFCRPQNLNFIVNEDLIKKRLVVTIYVDDKLAIQKSYHYLNGSEDDIHDQVTKFCNSLMLLTEDDIFELFDNAMAALYVYKFIKEVRTKAGKLVWQR